jgi:hypothetical protein
MSSPGAGPARVLQMYKSMLVLCKRLPAKERDSALQAVRSAFRANKDEDTSSR